MIFICVSIIRGFKHSYYYLLPKKNGDYPVSLQNKKLTNIFFVLVELTIGSRQALSEWELAYVCTSALKEWETYHTHALEHTHFVYLVYRERASLVHKCKLTEPSAAPVWPRSKTDTLALHMGCFAFELLSKHFLMQPSWLTVWNNFLTLYSSAQSIFFLLMLV